MDPVEARSSVAGITSTAVRSGARSSTVAVGSTAACPTSGAPRSLPRVAAVDGGRVTGREEAASRAVVTSIPGTASGRVAAGSADGGAGSGAVDGTVTCAFGAGLLDVAAAVTGGDGAVGGAGEAGGAGGAGTVAGGAAATGADDGAVAGDATGTAATARGGSSPSGST